MQPRSRQSERALSLCFLAVLCSVPVAQTCLELWRGERVQFTDVFRVEPTSKNLRQYEDTLREKSWFQQQLRPWVQQWWFQSLGDTGAKAIAGRNGWLYYRPDVRYLVEPDPAEGAEPSGKWVHPSEAATCRESVVQAVVRFRDQLRERGIALLVVPAPGKPSVYPEQLTSRAAGRELDFHSPTRQLLDALRRQNVATVDLFATFQDARRAAHGLAAATPLYLARDTHWTPQGAKLAAQATARALRERGWAPAPRADFQVQPVRVNRWGDILDMMQLADARRGLAPEPALCEQVRDPVFGLFVPTGSDRPGAYKYPGQSSTVLVLGDSFCRIYQFPEPQSLGEPAEPSVSTNAPPAGERATKRLLPGSAGFIAHLALALKAPVDAMVSDGGASTDVRRRLSTHPEILEGKKVVVWEFVERDIYLGRAGWEHVPLPPRLN
jgi:hypothetical protein